MRLAFSHAGRAAPAGFAAFPLQRKGEKNPPLFFLRWLPQREKGRETLPLPACCKARLSPTLSGERTGHEGQPFCPDYWAGLRATSQKPLGYYMKLLAVLTIAFAGNPRGAEHEIRP